MGWDVVSFGAATSSDVVSFGAATSSNQVGRTDWTSVGLVELAVCTVCFLFTLHVRTEPLDATPATLKKKLAELAVLILSLGRLCYTGGSSMSARTVINCTFQMTCKFCGLISGVI